MPQLLGLALIGAGVIAGYRAYRFAADRVREEMERRARAEAEAAARDHQSGPLKDLGALELDPQTGVYRPRAH
jgi:hypothetical protein